MKYSGRTFGKSFVVSVLMFSLLAVPVLASSHREAPLISMDPYADNTDVYAFRSTEAGRSGFVTLIANFVPFQIPSGGPQFYRFDDTVLYDIKIDNTGDGVEDITYRFQFDTNIVNRQTVLGHTAVNQDGIVLSLTDPDYNMPQTYSVERITEGGTRRVILAKSARTPPNNVGPRVTPDYEANLGSRAVYNQPNGGRFFAGQRDESFFVDLGGTFDGLGYRSLAATGGVDTLRWYNILTIAIEVPIQELTRSLSIPASPTAPDAVIGVWSTTSRQELKILSPPEVLTAGNYRQISRLGNPLVNELIVPLGLKDFFNALPPSGDSILVPFVLNPQLPNLIETIFETYGPLGGPPIPISVPPPPRNDLAQIFALGIPAGAIPSAPFYTTVIAGSNGPHEYLRLNVAIPPSNNPSRLGLLGGDLAGFPNGRRVFDDVVDIELRAAVGGTPFTPEFNTPPNNALGDGVATNWIGYLNRFPYAQTPNPGNFPRPPNFPALQTFPVNPADGFLPMVDESGKLSSLSRARKRTAGASN